MLKTTLIRDKSIRWLIIYSALVFGFNQAAVWFYQPYFKISGVDILYFGIIFATFHIIAAMSAKHAHSIERKIGEKLSLISLVVLTAASYLLMGNIVFLFSFLFAFIQQFVKGFSKPVLEDRINKLISPSVRATVLSVKNLAGNLLYAAIIPVMGWVADVYTLTQALTIIGLTTLISGGVILLYLRANRII